MKYNSFVYDLFDSFAGKGEIDPLCIVDFRTDYDYEGSFGFDWLRIDEPQAKEPSYKSIIQSGYKDGKSNLSKREAYKRLENEYKHLLIKRRPFTAAWFMGRDKYFVPYLNLFSKEYSDTISSPYPPPYRARLRVLIEIEQEIDRIEFVYDTDLFTVNTDALMPITNKCKQLVAGAIIIECYKDFDDEQEINVYAYPADSSASTSQTGQAAEKTLAGRLIVRPNSAIHRTEVKVALVHVLTGLESRQQKGPFHDAEIKHLHDAFYQVLLVPIIYDKRPTRSGMKDIVLDLVKDPHFASKTGKYIQKRSVNEDADGHSIFRYVREQFLQKPYNTQYRDYFLMFSFGVKSCHHTHGEVEAVGKKSLLLFKNREMYFWSMSHEALHGYGLLHTHIEPDLRICESPDRKYVYPHGHDDPDHATDNLMSYRLDRMLTTWKWQWDIIRKNL